MKIVAVDNISQRLNELERTVMMIFPEAAVKSFVDPMIALNMASGIMLM